MRRALAWLWRWSWLPGLCFVVWSALCFAGLLRQFATFGIDRRIEPFTVELGALGREAIDYQLRRLLPAAPAPSYVAGLLRDVHLHLTPDDLARLDSDLPYSGRREVPGRLEHAGRTQQVEVRYRGDTFVHWGRRKKSFRVQTTREDLFDGMRTFNLVVPKKAEQLNDYLVYWLARRLGLLAPRADFVRLHLNGSYHGLYLLVEQVGESTLRANDRLPGDVYRGELLLRTAWTGLPNDLFSSAHLWDKIASRDREAAQDFAPLEALIAAINEPADEASARRLGEIVDLDKFARFAILTLITQSHHADHFHNWRLYWDPWRRRFEPIVWDLVGWEKSMRPAEEGAIDLHPAFEPLLARLHGSLEFLAARDRVLRAFHDEGGEAALVAELARAATAIDQPLVDDPHPRPAGDATPRVAISELAEAVSRILFGIRKGLAAPERLVWRVPADRPGIVLLQVTTVRPLRTLALEFADPVRPTAVKLRLPRASGHTEIDLGERWQAVANRLEISTPLASELEQRFTLAIPPVRNRRLRARPTCFELAIAGADLRDLRAVRADGDRPFEASADLVASPAGDLFVACAPPPAAPLVLAGEVAVAGRREIRQRARIEPGTTFRLEPGACLVFRNQVQAEGTLENPIRFLPAGDAGPPWGAVVLDGEGCNGSVLRACQLRHGAGAKEPLAELSGMLCIYGARDVRIADCELRGSAGEDAIHAVYSEVAFDRVVVDHAKGDGIDCDVSRVTVRDCSFAECGNDGLDLMTSRALVDGCRFVACRDKGLSVGERSQAIVLRSRLDRCGHGLEIKDASFVAMLHGEITDCTTSLAAARKDWRYGSGGRLAVHRSVLRRNAALAAADPASSIALGDCLVEPLPQPAPGVAFDACDERAAGGRHDIPFPTELAALRPDWGAAWAAACSPTRGVGPDTR